MKLTRLSPAILLGLSIAQAWALPDPRADLTKLTKAVSLQGIGKIMGDHEKSTVIYVAPDDMKVTGQFYQTSAGVSCVDLHNFRSILMKMPEQHELQTIYGEDRFVSPYYEVLIANALRSRKILLKIEELRNEAIQLRKDNQESLTEYNRTFQAKENLTAEYNRLKEQFDNTHRSMMAEISAAQTETERNSVRDTYRPMIKDFNEKLRQSFGIYTEANHAFSVAVGKWAHVRDELGYLEKLETDMRTTLANYEKTSKEAYDFANVQLNLMSNKIVGRATAAYSLATNKKVELLAERIKEAGLDYNVRHLDIFNVMLNPNIVRLEGEMTIGNLPTYNMVSYQIDPKTQISLGTTKRRVNLPATITEEGQEPRDLSFEVKEFTANAGSAQSFEMPITVASYCGQPEMKTKYYTVKTAEGETVRSKVTYPVFNENPGRVIYAQNVPLTYNFYQKAEPIEGRCELNITNSSAHIRNSGKKKSGGFFRRNTKSWDHTRHDYNKDMGLTCEMVKSPIGSNPEESALINEALEKSLYQDLFHMFIMSYAKEYTITEVPHTELGADSQFFSQVGGGVMNLCGKNKYCEFGSIVLKSMDDLVGSRHSGSSSHTQSSTGKIVKDFKLSSYLVSHGSTNVEMTVCLDRQSCK
jgi:hypothetical protein